MYADNPQVAGCTTLQDSSKHTLSTERWCSMSCHNARACVNPRNLEITYQHSIWGTVGRPFLYPANPVAGYKNVTFKRIDRHIPVYISGKVTAVRLHAKI